MKQSQLAIVSVTTRQKDLIEALDAYAQAGFSNVEFVLPLVKDWLRVGHNVNDVLRLLNERHMHCIGGFETTVTCFGTPEEIAVNHMLHLHNAKLVHQLGGRVLVVGTDGPNQSSYEAIEVISKSFRLLAEQLEGTEVSLALEFNWSPCIKSLKSAALVCEQVAHPQVGILFDPAHYYTTTTKFEHLTPETMRWIRHMHVDDMQDKPGELSNCNDDRTLPGQAIVGLPALLAALERYGYNGYYSIEMFSEDLWSRPASEAARLCYQSLLPLCE
jgi:4-hydroxyphenylpyruvate dioxygenase